jgi:hypothetical protein
MLGFDVTDDPNINPGNHAFILFTPRGGSDANAIVFRGGGGGPGGSSGTGSTGAGTIIVVTTPHQDALDDYQRWQNQNGPRFLLLAGEEACEQFTCFSNQMSIINSLSVDYRVTGPNSNTAAREMLEGCRLPQVPPAGAYPGWGMSLR